MLADLRGSRARLWMFHATFNRLAIMLSRPGEEDVMYVIAAGCVTISAPVQWGDADISVEAFTGARPDGVRHRIVDVRAGVEVTCSSIVLLRAPTSDFYTSFDDFLQDVPQFNQSG